MALRRRRGLAALADAAVRAPAWVLTALALLLSGAAHAAEQGEPDKLSFVEALRSFREGKFDETNLCEVARAELLRLPRTDDARLGSAATSYLAAAKALVALRPQAVTAGARRLSLDPRSRHVDPWRGLEQEPGWQPEWTEIAVTNEPRILKPVPIGVAGAWIPARYRLAEVLGLGTNHVHATVLLVDPAFETGSIPRYFVESVIRFSLVGTFHPAPPRSAGSHVRPDTSTNFPAVETFQHELDSRRRVIHLRIPAGPEVRPDRAGELDHGFEEMDKGRYGGWFNDRLAERLAEHSWPRGRSEVQRAREAPAESALNEAIAARLHEWREASRVEFLRLADAAGLSRRLRDSRATLLLAERGVESGRTTGVLPLFAEKLPDLEAMAAPQDLAIVARRMRLAELHALVHLVEPAQRARAALVVLAVAQALAEGTTETTDER